MTDKVERVARAICEAGNVPGFKCVCPHPVDGWCLGERLKLQARAAMEAMREPTSDMLNAGAHQLSGYIFGGTSAALDTYEAMIDAALESSDG